MTVWHLVEICPDEMYLHIAVAEFHPEVKDDPPNQTLKGRRCEIVCREWNNRTNRRMRDPPG